jgi:hypothetical protein
MTASASAPTILARRTLWLPLAVAVLCAWMLVLEQSWYPLKGWTKYVLPAFWTSLTLLYAVDRRLRFRLLYEGALGACAYFFLWDVPRMLGCRLPVGYSVLLVLTGILAALPFGRRGAGVAAVSGGMLASLWIVYRVGHAGCRLRLGTMLASSSIPSIGLILLGGLLCERLTRRWRGDEAFAGASPALWGFVLGVTLPRLLQGL